MANIDKHGVDFRLAAAIFFGPILEADDTREDDMTENDTKTYSASDIAKMVASGNHSPVTRGVEEPGSELDRAFWDNARVVMPGEAPKVPISLRVDAEVLSWFRDSGKGYLSRMNAVLRAYVEAHKHPHA